MQQDTPAYIKSCHFCQLAAPNLQLSTAGLQPTLDLFHTFSMDFAELLPMTHNGNKYLLIAVEHLTGWPIVRAVSSQTSNVAIKFFKVRFICNLEVW